MSTNSYNEVRKMKSNKQRRIEIKARRRKRAESAKAKPLGLSIVQSVLNVEANLSELTHTGTYGLLPLFYIDKHFACRDCKKNEVWTASSQKWWYEVAKGGIDTTAVRCLTCRKKRRREKEQQKLHMEIMAQRVPHRNEAFFRKRY